MFYVLVLLGIQKFKKEFHDLITFCQTKTLWTTATAQNTMPKPMTTEDTIAGVESKWRNV